MGASQIHQQSARRGGCRLRAVRDDHGNVGHPLVRHQHVHPSAAHDRRGFLRGVHEGLGEQGAHAPHRRRLRPAPVRSSDACPAREGQEERRPAQRAVQLCLRPAMAGQMERGGQAHAGSGGRRRPPGTVPLPQPSGVLCVGQARPQGPHCRGQGFEGAARRGAVEGRCFPHCRARGPARYAVKGAQREAVQGGGRVPPGCR